MSVNSISYAVMAIVIGLSAPLNAAEGKHEHKAKVFASASTGLVALDAALALAKNKANAGDLKALGPISEDLHGIAEGLGMRLVDVSAENKERFKFNVSQVDALHAQLESAQGSKEDANRVIKRLEDVTARLKTLAPAK